MSKLLQKISAPTAILWLYVPVLISLSVLSSRDTNHTGADLVVQLSFPVVLSLWVLADAHKRGRRLCYDYGSFVFLAWPFIIPIYLFQTRGVRALITLLCFVGLCVLGVGFGFLLLAIRNAVLP